MSLPELDVSLSTASDGQWIRSSTPFYPVVINFIRRLLFLDLDLRNIFFDVKGFHIEILRNDSSIKTVKGLKLQLRVKQFNGDVPLGQRLHGDQSMEHLAQIKRQQ